MKLSKLTPEQLNSLSIEGLQMLDIESREEELMVQTLIDKKLQLMPVIEPIEIPSSATDNITPEKEAELQAKIDAKTLEYKNKVLSREVPIEEDASVDPEETDEETEQEEQEEIVAKNKGGRPRKMVAA
jgi:hypothetical protein